MARARRRWSVALAAALVLLAAPARAEEVESFVARWLEAQNRGDFAAYEALYGEGFKGVRSSGRRTVPMGRAEWMKDRARMFRKPMVVEARGIKRVPAPDGILVELEQTWSSEGYKDVGTKRLLVVDVGGSPKIAREELFESKRVLLPGQVMKVFVSAATLAEAEAIRAGFAELVGGLQGVEAWPVRISEDPLGVVVLACERDGFSAMAETARALVPRATARVVTEPPAACPTLVTSRDADERWSWPITAEARVGKRTVTVLATAYMSTDFGDFGRERRGFHFVALYRDEKGKVLSSMKGDSASDFSQLESLFGEGPKVEIVETFVDAPCDGTNRHRYRRLRRTTALEPDPSNDGTLRATSHDRTLERGSCDDAAYRDWVRQMERAR